MSASSAPAPCPSCGAALAFTSSISLLAVCPFCRSLVMRKDLALEDLGKVAQLQPDGSLLQLGATGRHKNREFTVVGRLQMRYDSGFWNEWFLRFEDERTGWLGEAQGLYAVSFQAGPGKSLPAGTALALGQLVRLGDETFTVQDLHEAKYVSAEGELPFKPPLGESAKTADLRGPGGRFATLDFSDDPPLLFLGEYAAFEDLSLSGLREQAKEEGSRAASAQTIKCTHCGGTLELRLVPVSLSIACQYCGSVLDAQDPGHKIISKYRRVLSEDLKPLIPIGKRGTLRGDELTVLGYLRRAILIDGIEYEWGEYLLHNPLKGYRWLVESEGHWTYLTPLPDQPEVG